MAPCHDTTTGALLQQLGADESEGGECNTPTLLNADSTFTSASFAASTPAAVSSSRVLSSSAPCAGMTSSSPPRLSPVAPPRERSVSPSGSDSDSNVGEWSLNDGAEEGEAHQLQHSGDGGDVSGGKACVGTTVTRPANNNKKKERALNPTTIIRNKKQQFTTTTTRPGTSSSSSASAAASRDGVAPQRRGDEAEAAMIPEDDDGCTLDAVRRMREKETSPSSDALAVSSGREGNARRHVEEQRRRWAKRAGFVWLAVTTSCSAWAALVDNLPGVPSA